MVAVIFLISGIDDVFVDLCYLVRGVWRKLFVLPRYPRVTESALEAKPEQHIAILIPAWNEGAVIRRMLLNAVGTFHYENYQIFVGTYPNDEATGKEVELVRERHENVERVVCPDNGPTNKADCLNWLYHGISHFEHENGIQFEIFVMHDSEDIVHPMSLRLFNYLMPRKHMVQLPVFALEQETWSFTGGHYVDEFAEHHRKNMVVREALSGRIPSAGVGCAFSREAVEKMAASRKGQLFNIKSMTEDYDFGMNIRTLGLSSIFVKFPVERTIPKVNRLTGKPYEVKVKEFIGTREFFPDTLRAAVKQRARWIVGIAFQGWAQLGWRGGFWSKYQLLQDRKQLVTGFFNVLGYVVLVIAAAVQIHNWLVPDSYRYPALVQTHTWLWYVVIADTFFMFERFFWRGYCVQRIYGWKQAFLSVPRQVWGNGISFAAVCRAFYLYTHSLLTGQRIAWEKTEHTFPSEKDLLAFRRRLGDLLLERRLVTVSQLEAALKQQELQRKPLGRILIQSGLLQEEQVTRVVSTQLSIPAVSLDPYQTPIALLEMLPFELAVKYSIYPVRNGSKNGNGNGGGNGNGKRLLVASENPLNQAAREHLESILHLHIEVCLATRSDIAFAIRRGYERLAQYRANAAESRKLGEYLIAQGKLTEAQLTAALKLQRESYRRLGDILLDQNIITHRELDFALESYAAAAEPLGAYLVRRGLITPGQLANALEVQAVSFRRLGEIVATLGIVPPDSIQGAIEGAAQ